MSDTEIIREIGIDGHTIKVSSFKGFNGKQPNKKAQCNGFVIDYARYHLNYVQTLDPNKRDYVQKLNRKVIEDDNSQKFSRRIFSYHKKLQTHSLIAAHEEIILEQKINEKGFWITLSEEKKQAKVIGLSIYCEKGAHIIAISMIRNTNQDPIGYKVFDPNIGEFIFSSSSMEKNIEAMDHCIKSIISIYKKELGLLNKLSISDLGNIVKSLDLTKDKKLPGKTNYKIPKDEKIIYIEEVSNRELRNKIANNELKLQLGAISLCCVMLIIYITGVSALLSAPLLAAGLSIIAGIAVISIIQAISTLNTAVPNQNNISKNSVVNISVNSSPALSKDLEIVKPITENSFSSKYLASMAQRYLERY